MYHAKSFLEESTAEGFSPCSIMRLENSTVELLYIHLSQQPLCSSILWLWDQDKLHQLRSLIKVIYFSYRSGKNLKFLSRKLSLRILNCGILTCGIASFKPRCYMGTHTEAHITCNNWHCHKSRSFWSMSAETLRTAACLVNASLQLRTVHRSMSFSSVLRKSHVL